MSERQTWRERNPDKYRACQRETMRRRRAASRASETPVSAVERVAGTAALQECEGRAPTPMTRQQWAGMTAEARCAWLTLNRPDLTDDGAVQAWLLGLV